ncbi:2-isopropylmalate synthase [Moraxella bovoculi]|uniref:hydroxymethylglutaryl-CoA lyase n=1 Tax=Moraxella bovoculi TaxID=386891 RepID=A0AAC8PX64_9GAMM|nr:hydroxymethylglutaryl-CoA lyase [Moraxella bovoculi]AKG08618.1 2-isopropylmalate synthase [Moraxella bovoculi]AKG10454.1 2-isopropylmalate synthase [Moraxella bovoculi]AKG12479.1 2-isopropylmalate synthase [Moraxella bovoculi]AKG14440.1 2-isopropylmalate synthase [Moraxella bovoculi]
MKPDIKIVEVGARDGLQNEKTPLSVDDKLTLIQGLADANLKFIEAGSCVSPKWVPQMAGSTEIFGRLPTDTDVNFSLLTPNLRGFEDALAVGCKEVVVFTGASETFTQKNINCSIDESIDRFADILALAKEHDIKVRGYVSCVVDCPYEGATDPKIVAKVARRLYDMGCYEISLGETIGTATPNRIKAMLQACMDELDISVIAGHYHNTYGMAIANIHESLNMGVRIFDASVGSLGGCPYAKGASGNVATEDVHYLMTGLGLSTGIDIDKLVKVSADICQKLNRDNGSMATKAYLANCS